MPPAKPAIAVLHEDDAILVVNKPSGLSVTPDRHDAHRIHIRSELARQGYPELMLVHRLDRDTSGALILAKHAEAHRQLNIQFSGHSVRKVYEALCVGQPLQSEMNITVALRPDADRQHRTLVDTRAGKPSETHLKELSRFGPYTLIQAEPKTGRTHQVRVHLWTAGAPICGDELYGQGGPVLLSAVKKSYRPGRSGMEKPLMERLALHAASLTCAHPISGDPISFVAPHAHDFAVALKQLSRYAR